MYFDSLGLCACMCIATLSRLKKKVGRCKRCVEEVETTDERKILWID